MTIRKKKMTIRKKKMNMRKIEILEGYTFVLPYIIGVLAFFVYPLVFSMYISSGELKIVKGGFDFTYLGLENYINAFVKDVDFTQVFVAVIRDTLINTPLIVVFSLILAIILNKSLALKGFYRTIFFLPFLLGSGYVMRQLLGMGVSDDAMAMARGIILPDEVLQYLGPFLADTMIDFLGRITWILWKSGVQIILFLSGIQGISKSLYEASMCDGATEWDMFWKITLPMISPVTLLVLIFTIIDSFVDPTNPMVDMFFTRAFRDMRFSYSAAMSWIYFLFIMLFLGLIFLIMKRFVHNEIAK